MRHGEEQLGSGQYPYRLVALRAKRHPAFLSSPCSSVFSVSLRFDSTLDRARRDVGNNPGNKAMVERIRGRLKPFQLGRGGGSFGDSTTEARRKGRHREEQRGLGCDQCRPLALRARRDVGSDHEKDGRSFTSASGLNPRDKKGRRWGSAGPENLGWGGRAPGLPRPGAGRRTSCRSWRRVRVRR